MSLLDSVINFYNNVSAWNKKRRRKDLDINVFSHFKRKKNKLTLRNISKNTITISNLRTSKSLFLINNVCNVRIKPEEELTIIFDLNYVPPNEFEIKIKYTMEDGSLKSIKIISDKDNRKPIIK